MNFMLSASFMPLFRQNVESRATLQPLYFFGLIRYGKLFWLYIIDFAFANKKRLIVIYRAYINLALGYNIFKWTCQLTKIYTYFLTIISLPYYLKFWC